MSPTSLTDGALLALAVPVLFILLFGAAMRASAVHVCRVVTADTTTVVVKPAAAVPKLQLSTCAPTAPLIVQPAVAVVQVTPPPAGSGSLSVKAFAAPGPLFVTTIVNVAVAPAVIVPPSGVL